jgi:hypothetical protein
MEVFVSGYQLIDMHCIALPVKFDGGLSISFLRKKQLLKKLGAKVYLFKKVPTFKPISNPAMKDFSLPVFFAALGRCSSFIGKEPAMKGFSLPALFATLRWCSSLVGKGPTHSLKAYPFTHRA